MGVQCGVAVAAAGQLLFFQFFFLQFSPIFFRFISVVLQSRVSKGSPLVHCGGLSVPVLVIPPLRLLLLIGDGTVGGRGGDCDVPPPRPLLLGGSGTAGSLRGDCGRGGGRNIIEGKEKIRYIFEVF